MSKTDKKKPCVACLLERGEVPRGGAEVKWCLLSGVKGTTNGVGGIVTFDLCRRHALCVGILMTNSRRGSALRPRRAKEAKRG